MRVSGNILFGLLSHEYRLVRYGKGAREKELSLPVFWERGMKARPGSIYLAHTGDLPSKPPEGCVFICDGTRPSKVWNMWPCDVIYVENAQGGLVDVFNTVQRILDELVTWEDHMQKLQSSGANVRELVEESIPIFENRVTVCDYELRILAGCDCDEKHPEHGYRMVNDLERVPIDKMLSAKDSRLSAIRKREPYFFDVADGTPTYCINFYLGDTYIGSCSLQGTSHPLEQHDLELFQLFAEYVRGTLAQQTRSMGNQLVTARTIFEQLLNGYPVSRDDMGYALRLIELNLGNRSIDDHKWCCVAIQSSHKGKALPEGYLCTTIESILPNATALLFDESIVAFCLIGNDDHRVDEICNPLEAYLADMGFKAGISRTFIDPFHVRDYYRQALCALESGYECDPDRGWYLFGDYALDYMLQNVCGEFEAKMMVPPELVRLWRLNTADVDYVTTLKAFLDNDCKITKTATAMYLHRTTLVKRLEKIRGVVNLDDPKRVLYLRICLNLPDVEQALEDSSDVS